MCLLTYIAFPITQLLKHFLKTLKVISLDELSTSTRIPPHLDALIEAGPESMLHYVHVCVCVPSLYGIHTGKPEVNGSSLIYRHIVVVTILRQISLCSLNWSGTQYGTRLALSTLEY